MKILETCCGVHGLKMPITWTESPLRTDLFKRK